MRNLSLLSLAGLLGLTLFVATPGYSDDQKKTDEKTQTVQKPVAAEKTTAAKPRLPRGFGRLELTPEQHAKLTDVMKKYAPQIRELRDQIVELEKKETEELSAILTPQQKEQLAEARVRFGRSANRPGSQPAEKQQKQEKKD